MERKEQTGHICRWMALGIMTAIVIVGCTVKRCGIRKAE